jgi:hypothetical protein
MPGFQFGHIATFSLKGNSLNFSIDDVVAEAARQPGAHPHVEEPLPPTVIAGDFRPEDVPAEIRRRVRDAKAALRGVLTAEGKIQRIRDDTHVMEAQVHSHPIYTKPPPPDHDGEVRPHMDQPKERARYLRWRSDLVTHVYADAERRGLEVLCVVEHVDEAHPHVHALVVPLRTASNPRMDAKVTHPGHAAAKRRKEQAEERFKGKIQPALPPTEPEPTERKRTRKRRGIDIGRKTRGELKSEKARKKQDGPPSVETIVTQVGKRAYKAAMREWQGELYRSVSAYHGLARTGPGLERLTRREWWHRQNQNDAAIALNENRKVAEAASARYRDEVLAASVEADAAEARQKEAEEKAEGAERRLAALKPIEEAAANTISRADALQNTVAKLEAEEAAVRQRLSELSEHVAAAELKTKEALDAETKRTAAEKATADAEARRANAEAELQALQGQAQSIRREQAEFESEKAALDSRAAKLNLAAKEIDAKIRGLGAWASGRLGLDDEGRLILHRARKGRDIEEELDSLKPAEAWLADAVSRLEGMFMSRLSRASREMKNVVVSTVRAWSMGLIYRSKAHASGLAVRSDDFPERSQEFVKETAEHPDLVQAVVPLLPDLTTVHDVQAMAEKSRSILTVAEDRHLRNTQASIRRLRGSGYSRP